MFETLGQAFGALGGVVLVPGRDGAGDREELGFDPGGEATSAKPGINRRDPSRTSMYQSGCAPAETGEGSYGP